MSAVGAGIGCVGAVEPEPGAMRAQILTKSYGGDAEVCRALCASIDRFVDADIGHRLIVPASDLPRFADLASARRTIVTEDRLLPWWFVKLPLPGQPWRQRLHLPRRDVYVIPFGLPVRGWIAQQIMKIAAAAQADAEVVVHVDSDNVFVRRLRFDDLVRDGRVRLYRDPVPVDLATHRRWQASAGRLLGLPPATFYGGEYIDPFVVWRRSLVRAMIARIERVAGRGWLPVLATTPHFAEYVLYGVHADRIVGLDAAELFATDRTLCHARWADDFADGAAQAAFAAALLPEHRTCLIQSTIATPMAARQHVFDLVEAVAARQDEAPARPAD